MIYDTKLARLKVIPAGYGSLNPAEILSDIKLTELLERLKQNYDVVIIDTPPIVFVSEIFQLREIIDFNIIVVRHHYTPKAVLKLALAEIKDHRMKENGIIFNNVSGHHEMYGYKKYGYSDWYKWGNECSIQNSKKEELSKVN
jgi:Mrp family chromosome partitioning ATPase